MARLFEHQGKELLRRYGLNIPRGQVATSVGEVAQFAAGIAGGVVIKAQVLHTGRGKKGGIKITDTAEESRGAASDLFTQGVASNPVDRVLVEERILDAAEYFVGITLDDSIKRPVLMISPQGGEDIEELARYSPDLIGRIEIDYLTGLSLDRARQAVKEIEFPADIAESLAVLLVKFWETFKKYEMTSLEINPLFSSSQRGLVAGDCKATVDDYAFFRHPELEEMIDIPREFSHAPTELEKVAWLVEKDDYRGTFYFSQLVEEIDEDGYIGYHGGGGGGSMAGMDKLKRLGLKAACYVDTSGNPPGSKVYRAVKLILSIPGIQGYLCFSDAVASQDLTVTTRGIIKAVKEIRPDFPAIIRLVGYRSEEAQRLVRETAEKWGLNLEYYGHEKSTLWCIERMKTLIGDNLRDGNH